MAKIQTRRSISISLELYRRLSVFCTEAKLPMSQLVSAGVEAIIRGDVKIAGYEPAERPHSDDGRFCRAAEAATQASRVNIIAGLSPTVALPLSLRLYEDVAVQANREDVDAGTTLDRAVNRMIDRMSAVPWCLSCLEATEYCRCAVTRAAGAR